MLFISRIAIFGFERFLPLSLYFYYLYIEDIALIKILTSVQLIAAFTELGFRNSLGVETENIKSIVRLHVLASLSVLIYLITFSELEYFYLYCVIQIMIAAGGCYKLKQIKEIHFFGIAFAICFCLIGLMISNKFIIFLALTYFFLLTKLFNFVKGTESTINFVKATNISKYAILSLPIVIVMPLDLYVSSIVFDEFLTYHNTVRMLVVASLPFVIFNYFNNINIKSFTYKMFLIKNFPLYLVLFAISLALMLLIENLGVLALDLKLTISFIALMLFGPIYQFTIRISKKLAYFYLFMFYLMCFIPYYFIDILAAKLICNLLYFCFLLLISGIVFRYESYRL